MLKIDYIQNDPKLGVNYDWNKILKEFKKLNIPKDVYSPEFAIMQSCKYNVGVSERSTGKTTNWVLIGLVMNKLYGTITQYIRQSEDMITPKYMRPFMDVIVKNGYVEKITDGKYNDCFYRARNWFYCKTVDGEQIEKAAAPFMYCLDLDEAQTYKSSYNAPLGDLIIFDEFVSKRYYPNEFVTFCDIVKTIIRERLSPVVVMLANTTDRYHTYFQELTIQQEILNIKVNEYFKKTTAGGTTIFCELIGNKNLAREKQNTLFFGFNNPRLASITGGDWAIDNYPHIVREDCKTLNTSHYIAFNNYLVNIELCQNKRLGTFCKAHKATKTYDDSIIYSIDGIPDKRFRHKFGYNAVDGMLFLLLKRNKWFYSTNEVGNVVSSYVAQAKKLLW